MKSAALRSLTIGLESAVLTIYNYITTPALTSHAIKGMFVKAAKY